MVSVITILLFFVYTWGLGYSATYFAAKSKDCLENFFMNIGIGLGVFAILSIFLNTLQVILDWKIFLILSLILPAFSIYKRNKTKNWRFDFPKLTKANITTLIVLIIFIISLSIYLKGAFTYPYLENEDPWGHSEGIKYVALEKTAFDPEVTRYDKTVDAVLPYIDPYPPAYNILLGVLHQTSPNLTWTMKFFNALIISLGFVFFYFFVNRFCGDRKKALLATFILAAIPSYLSHFIWAHSLVVTLIFPTFYALEMIKEDRRWAYVAMLLIAAVWVSQNLSKPIQITILILIYLVVISITHKKIFKRGFAALFGGLVLSIFWWGAVLTKYGFGNFVAAWQPRIVEGGEIISAASGGLFSKLVPIIKSVTDAGGSASRAYGFNDFFIAKSQNLINNPIGIGVFITLLALVGLVATLIKYRSKIVNPENTWLAVTILWLVFTFWGVNGVTFPVSIARGAFRVWMLMAIPLSIITVEGIYFLKVFSKKNKVIFIAILVVIIVGIFFTSAKQKYDLNTAIWPTSSAFSNPQEAYEMAVWFNTIPDNTKVFLYAPRPKFTIGLGKYSCNWCQDEIDFRAEIITKSGEELYNFLKNREYEYLLVAPNLDYKLFSSEFSDDIVKEQLPLRYQEILNSGLFKPVYQKEQVLVVFEVK